MIAKIRAIFFKNALGKLLAEQKRQRKTNTLQSARTIGILFDATSETVRQDVLEYVKKLEKDGKKVQILGFFDTKQPPENQSFDYFFLKETTWQGIPKSEKAKTFSKEKFDLLLCLNRDDRPSLEWLAIESPAAMKIGFATDHLNDYDIQLETPEGKGVRFFTEQLSIYLDKIVLTKS